jgi:Putative DNA-binding domain
LAPATPNALFPAKTGRFERSELGVPSLGVAHSVAELLPRPFSELTLEDVGAIIESVGEERETLFFERKASVSGAALAKACAAFANTLGGLLVVGVADNSDELLGIEPLAAEAQLWVKDTLRGLVLPMPPFRARWLPIEGDRGMLVVLVEESMATPHLLTRSGAIYVRNPGSSDPVPLADQRRLLELTARGERAQADAIEEVRRVLGYNPEGEFFAPLEDFFVPIETLALAATGTTADLAERLFSPGTPDYLGERVWGELGDNDRRIEGRWAAWGREYVGVRRRRQLRFVRGALAEGVVVTRSGGLMIYRGFLWDAQPDDDPEDLVEREIRERFERWLDAGREILAELGAHGDLRLLYRLDPNGQSVHIRQRFVDLQPADYELWVSFEDESVAETVFAEIARAAGLGPVAG